MFKNIASLCATILSALGIPPAEADDKTMEKLVVTPGDLVVQQNKNGWMAIKILAVDPWPDGSAAAHCLTYESVPDRPTLESLKEAPVRALHAPIDAGSFSAWERLGNQAPSKEDLAGFIEYLKLTDFPRYVAFTGQDAMEIVRKANEHYNRANALGEKGKRVEAIAEYSQAIELFPLYYEAIDNRAFTHMELGNLREALVDFEQSLRVYPDGSTAFFSKGECLMKLGELKAAEAIFEEGLRRFPAKRAAFTMFLEQVRALRKNT